MTSRCGWLLVDGRQGAGVALALIAPPIRLTIILAAPKIRKACNTAGSSHTALPPRSTAGQLTLDQHIGVRIPGGQPIFSVSCPVKFWTADFRSADPG